MLNTFFYFTLNMSLASCAVIAALLIVRLIPRLQRRVVYPMWVLALLRLTVPFAPSGRWSVYNLADGLIKRLVSSPQNGDTLLMMNFFGAAEKYAPVEYKTESLRRVFTTGAIVWALIAAAALISAVVLYLLTRAELKKAVLIRGNLYRSDMLLSPLLTGVLRTRIILPPALDPDSDEGAMVLRHEEVHRRRLDNLWRIIAICTACVHWFNPLVWIGLRAFFADMERSCDEAVIRGYGVEQRRTYAAALLRFAEDKRVLVSTAFGQSGVRVRIVNVLKYKKLSLIGAVASTVFLIAVAVVLVTNPQIRG